MEKVKQKQEDSEVLGIDQLLKRLEKINDAKERLSEAAANQVFRQIYHEIPYSVSVLHPHLIQALISDTPLKKSNNTLNQVINNLGRALCDPSQVTQLAKNVQVYLQSRKITEKAYAATVAEEVMSILDLSAFPANSKAAIRGMMQSILEKIINEKQCRKMSGYSPQPLIEMIDPLIHNRLANPELDRLRSENPLQFRSMINEVAQTSYEKANDDQTFVNILIEKQAAFLKFSEDLAENTPNDTQLGKLRNKIWFSQRDKNQKHEAFMKELDLFLRVLLPRNNLSELGLQLRLRASEHFRNKINSRDREAKIYLREETIKASHEASFNEIQFDANGIRLILTDVLSIDENFTTAFFHKLLAKKKFNVIEIAMTDILLGKMVTKRHHLTDDIKTERLGGYPHKNVNELFGDIIAALKEIQKNTKGLFHEAFKQEIEKSINLLEKHSQELRIQPVVSQDIVAEEPNTAEAQTIAEAPIQEALKVPPPPTAKPLLVDTTIEEPAPTKPSAPKPLEIDASAFDTEEPINLEKVEAKPLEIDASAFDTEEPISLEPVKPKPLAIDTEAFDKEEPISLENVQPKPLAIDTEAFDKEEPISLEKVEAKPLEIDASAFDEEPIVFETVTPKPAQTALPKTEVVLSPTALEAIESGKNIMGNYELGDMMPSVTDAWKTVVIHSAEEHPDDISGEFASESEVLLYVICDLVQQVVSVDPASLAEDKKVLYADIRSRIQSALMNPSDPQNWEYFEGAKRDEIDQQLWSLKS